MDQFGLVVVPHPLGNREQMVERVRHALPQIVRILTGVEAPMYDSRDPEGR